MKEYNFMKRIPAVEEYRKLRESVGWRNLVPEAMERGLGGSLFSVCVLHQEKVVGCGRVIGDGGIYFYVQDIIVHPEHQGKGLGRQIMKTIMSYISRKVPPGAFVGLMAAEGVAGFYEGFGFKRRPLDAPGMYLAQDINPR